ncbi:TPA: lysis protein [Pseudomonas aeruginosa]|nr:lysis protein [Pseudomonas aeruginosa]
MAVLNLLRTSTFWLVLSAVLCGAAVVIHGSASYDRGYAAARAEGDAALLNLQLQHANERAQAVQDSLIRYQQQVTRTNEAEQLLLTTQQQLVDANQQLQERIPHVTTVYRPAPAAAPVALPRCVFTRGFVRDLNLALGAGVPAAGAGALAAGAAQEAWPAPGSDAELLESGVGQADLLAYAQDYGRWARSNAAQLTALLDLHDRETK